MAEFVCQGALMTCSFGLAPGELNVTSQTDVSTAGAPLATILDTPQVPGFGLCTSLANPAVAAATAAALGVLTPMPCIPVISAPWTPGSPDVRLGGIPAVLDDDTCQCAYGGEILITFPGQEEISGSG
jgi:uncharacterized Zn-binding protein involved in type VI secretion